MMRRIALSLLAVLALCAAADAQTYRIDGPSSYDPSSYLGGSRPPDGIRAATRPVESGDAPYLAVSARYRDPVSVSVWAAIVEGPGANGNAEGWTSVAQDTTEALAKGMHRFEPDLSLLSWQVYNADELHVVTYVYDSGGLLDSQVDVFTIETADLTAPVIASFTVTSPDSNGINGNWFADIAFSADEAGSAGVKFATSIAGLAFADTIQLGGNISSYDGRRDTRIALEDHNGGNIYCTLVVTDASGNASATSNTVMAASRAVPEFDAVVAGANYWLPDGFPEPTYSAYERGGYSSTNPNDVTIVYNIDWADIETAPATYSWTALDNLFTIAQTYGKRLSLRILNSARLHSEPQMARIPVHYHTYLSEIMIPSTWDFAYQIYQANVWHPTVAAGFNAFVAALGARYADSPQLDSVYIHAISASRGEEFFLEPLEDTTPLADEWNGGNVEALRVDLENWLEGRMDAFGDAFEGYEYKCVWVGGLADTWPWFPGNGLQSWYDMAESLVDYAWTEGFGNRSGIVELWSTHLEDYALGTSISDDGYLLLDDTIPPIAQGRYFGDENEAYGESWSWWYGADHSSAHRFRFSTLEALRRQVNHLYTSVDAAAIDPDLHAYAEVSMGHTVDTSPDAWCYLRETPSSLSPTGGLKNFERWLIQRDLEEGETVPSQWQARTFNSGQDAGNGTDSYGDYTARRTDIATGNSRIFFQADADFDVTDTLRVMIEVVDEEPTSWAIDYVNAASDSTRTIPYICHGDGEVRTVTYEIYGMTRGGLDNGMDFAITALGDADVHVRWVRAVRTTYEEPTDTTAPTVSTFTITAADSTEADGNWRPNVRFSANESGLAIVKFATSVPGLAGADTIHLGADISSYDGPRDTRIALDDLNDGTIYGSLTVTDASDNTSTAASASLAVTREVEPDTTPPTLTAADSTYTEATELASINVTSDELFTPEWRYRVYDTSAGDWAGAWSAYASGDTTTTIFKADIPTGALDELDYVRFGVTGDDAASNTADEVYADSVVDRVPGAPTIGTATAGDGQLVVTWTDPVIVDVDSASVYVGTGTGGPYTLFASGLDVTAETVTVTGLTNSTTYYCVVTVTDASDQESDDSSEVSGAPVAASADGFVGTRVATVGNDGWGGTRFPYYSVFTADTTGTVSYAYMRRYATNQEFTYQRPVLWSSTGDTLAVGECGGTEITENLYRFTLNQPVSITQGTTYWCGLVSSDSSWQISVITGVGSYYTGTSGTSPYVDPLSSCPTLADFNPANYSDTMHEDTTGQLPVWFSNHAGEDGS